MYPSPEGSIFPQNVLRSLFKDRGRYSTLKGAPFHKHGLLRSDDAMATRTSKKKKQRKRIGLKRKTNTLHVQKKRRRNLFSF